MRLIQSPFLRDSASVGSNLIPDACAMIRAFLADRDLFVNPKTPYVDTDKVTELLDLLEAERDAWRKQKQGLFHANFGSEFTSGTSPTSFALMVTRYVDVYTSRVTNFLRYPGDYR